MNYQIGIDIVDNIRFKHLSQFAIKRMLTVNEYNEYIQVHDNYKHLYLASRWTTKEAIYKAINEFIKINLINIEILYKQNKNPYCTNIDNISLSISHTENFTIAIALYKIK